MIAMLNRREFLAVTGVSAVGAALPSVPRSSSVAALPLAKPDLTLRIAPGVVIKTTGYNMIFHNHTGDTHPLHLHRHDFEIVKIGTKNTTGIKKDIVNIARFSDAEVDFVANHPGPSLFHCHMQLHMDFGFMAPVKYS